MPPGAPAAGDLTEREAAVLRMLAGTASLREIADELFVSHNTVKTQVKSIYRKLGVAARADAVARGRELGLLAGSLAGGSAPQRGGPRRPAHGGGGSGEPPAEPRVRAAVRLA